MKDYLFDDFYEGFLQILLIAVPLSVGLFTQYALDNYQAVPLSLVLSIVSLIYSERNIYKKTEFSDNQRLKIELAISLLLLSVSLVTTLFEWHTAFVQQLDNQVKGYNIPIVLYSFSTLPYIFEALYVLIKKDLRVPSRQKTKNQKSSNKTDELEGQNPAFDFDLTCASKN